MPTTKTVTFTVYKFSELSEKAKDRARSDRMSEEGYSWSEDALKSIKALAEHFGAKMVKWEVDFFASSHSCARWELPDEYEGDSEEQRIAGLQAKIDELGSFNAETGKGNGDCVLTGYCADEDAIDGLRAAWKEWERDLGKLLDAAFKTWLAAAQSDCAWQYEDEQMSEHSDANGYEYLESGEMARG